MEHKGLFITFEGGEGSGKTTVAKMIVEAFREKGISVMLTREPGGVVIAEEIRDIIVDRKNTNMDPKTEALLYAASRRQHLVEKVAPALREGKIVISDRFIDSSLVYQGIARGIGIEKVYQMNLFATEELMPELTIFFDVSPSIGLSRIRSNDREVNRLDLEKESFHEKVYEGYQTICQMFPERIRRVDASLSKEEVYQQVLSLIEERL